MPEMPLVANRTVLSIPGSKQCYEQEMVESQSTPCKGQPLK